MSFNVTGRCCIWRAVRCGLWKLRQGLMGRRSCGGLRWWHSQGARHEPRGQWSAAAAGRAGRAFRQHPCADGDDDAA